MLNTMNSAIEYTNTPAADEKRIAFREICKAQTETLLKANAQINQLLTSFDKSAGGQPFELPEIPDFKTALIINLELSRMTADKIEGLRAMLGG